MYPLATHIQWLWMLGDNQEEKPGLLFPVPARREGLTDHCSDCKVLSHSADLWDFSRNRKYSYELDLKEVCKVFLCTSYWAELKYCHFAGCKPKHELIWLQRGWPHIIHHGRTDFCPKETKPKLQCDLFFFIQRTHCQFHWLLSDEFMPYIKSEEKIQIELSSAIPAVHVWLWEKQLIFKVVCSGFLDLATLVLYY